MPTLRLKLIATTLSGAFMGMAGAPLPYYIGYLDRPRPSACAYAVNSIAMPMIGGTTSWVGPLIGAILLGTIQQLATVTISSAVNLLIVGLLLVAFVIIAPNGIVGLVESWRRTRARAALDEPGSPLLAVKGVGKRFGGFVALEASTSTVSAGERLGLIGPNGSGKSTLVNCMCGTLHNETGSVRFRGQAAQRAHRARAHPSRPRPQLPAAAPLLSMTRGRQSARAAALHGAPPLACCISSQKRARRPLPWSCCARSASTPRPGACRAT